MGLKAGQDGIVKLRDVSFQCMNSYDQTQAIWPIVSPLKLSHTLCGPITDLVLS